MKKYTAAITCASLLFASTMHAEETTAPAQPAQVNQVGKAAEDGSNSAKDSKWVQFAIAGGAITVAIIALCLVSTHKGH